MMDEGKITPAEEAAAKQTPLGLHVQYPRNDLAPYFVEEIRKYLETTYGTEAVHERGLRVYTTLNISMQRAANQADSRRPACLRPPPRLARQVSPTS